MRLWFLSAAWLLLLATATAQEGQVPAFSFIRDHPQAFGVNTSDVGQLRVLDAYASADGTDHVYVGQLLHGTPVYNAQAAIHFRDGRVVYHTSRLQSDIQQRSVATAPALTADAAFSRVFPGSHHRLEVSDLVYYPLPMDSRIRLSWQLTVEEPSAGIHLLSLVDAVSGQEWYRDTLSQHCAFGGAAAGAGATLNPGPPAEPAAGLNDGAFYHVFPFGVESPHRGEARLVFEPADPKASPYGWHDTNGSAGPEYTITRGNNVYAYRDADDNQNKPDSAFVADGGRGLDFDFPYAPGLTPDSLLPASLTQLFYTTNMIHDWAYAHGFNEGAGNFQFNTYDRGGRGGDPVLAEAQDGAGTNNATFFTPADGSPGRMQLFLWRGPTYLVDVLTPPALAGRRPSSRANFGAEVGATGVAGELVIARDPGGNTGKGCGPLANAAAVKGKVVLIDRGDCTFQEKAFHAEQAGALAVIICNPANNLITMAGLEAPNEFPVTIPVVMLRESDCAPLRQRVATGETVTVSLSDQGDPPVDGSFDNGIVAHEYAHGISNRLVGGPRTNTCLLNDEQMGEGWSDFFLLASTPLAAGPRPTGREPRGIGHFSSSAAPNSTGLRTQFYSTDQAVSTHAYDDIITAAVPHGVGESWAAILWDVYWSLVDAYGFDPDLIHGSGGNNTAVRLVIEAMKYTPCSPGFTDARDGLLLADRFGNDGANECLLWEVFRRRGLGYSAEQGSTQLRNDNREAYDLAPNCIPTVKVSKEADRLYLAAGDTVTFTLTVRNDKSSVASGLILTDELPEGLTPILSTLTGGYPSTVEDGHLRLPLGDLPAGEQLTISYSARTDPGMRNERLFYSGAEPGEEDHWEVLAYEGDRSWTRTDTSAFSGAGTWFIPNVSSEQDQVLQTRNAHTLSGPAPALRFFTRYATEPAFDAGVVQLSTDGQNWQSLEGDFLRHGYRGRIDTRGKAALQGDSTFWGDSQGYRETIIDLSDYAGRAVYLRWRFVSDQSVGSEGWYVDEVELLPEVVSYDGMARITSAAGDRDSSSVSGPGVVVNAGEPATTSLAENGRNGVEVKVFPNPSRGGFAVNFQLREAGSVQLSLLSLAGQELRSLRFNASPGDQRAFFATGGLPAGPYTLRVTSPGGTTSLRVVLQ